MPTVPLNWNEVLIARMHQGQLTCWTAWRRSLEAFTNPRLWEDPALWAQHFTEQPAGSGWGFEGYGLVAMDMDQRRLWSIQDYQVPGDFHLPSDTLVVEDPHEHYAGLLALLAQPALWSLACLEARCTTPGTDASSGSTALTLGDVLDNGMGVDEAFERLTMKRGTLRVKDQDYLVFKGVVQVPGWTVSTDRGQEEPTFTVGVLATLQAMGWPAPDWTSVHARIGESFDEVEEDDKDALDAAYARMKADWPAEVGPTAPASADSTTPRANRAPRRP